MKPSSKLSGRRGFTLLEIIVTVSILSLVSAAIMGFFIESIRATFVSEQKNLVNNDIRQLTRELSTNARQANYILLYRSFRTADRNDVTDRLLTGEAGDFLVFGFQDPPDLSNPVFAPRPTRRMIGYYRLPTDPNDPDSLGPVRRFDLSFPAPGDPLNPPSPESLLPAEVLGGSFPEVVPLSQGLANGMLFYNFGGGTIMVNGKIIHGVEAKRVTDTYNFTISTRR